MGILDVKCDNTKQTLSVTETAFIAKRIFTVTLTEDTDPVLAPFQARLASGVPQYDDAHPYSWNIRVSNIQVDAINALFYQITVTYTSLGGGGSGDEADPLAEDWDVEWSFNATSEPIDKDIDGKALLNSSKEPFDPPISEDFHDLVLRVTRNEATFDPIIADSYMHTVNDGLFLQTFQPGQAKVVNYAGRPVKYNNGVYHIVNYEIHFRRDGWGRRLLDQGYRTKTGTDEDGKPTYATVLDDAGTPVSQPVLLDGAGGKLADGADEVYLTFTTKASSNFAFFGFEGYQL